MKRLGLFIRTFLQLVALSTLLSCGGGGREAAHAPANANPSVSPSSALSSSNGTASVAGATNLPDSGGGAPSLPVIASAAALAETNAASTERVEKLFDFAELRIPELLPTHENSRTSGAVRFRSYDRTGIFLGVAGDFVYVLGGPFGAAPVRVGAVSDFVSRGVPVDRVELGAVPTLVTAGDFVGVAAAALDSGGRVLSDVALRWQSSNPAVAQVTERGLIMVTGEGTAFISASAGRSSASVTVRARAREVPYGRVMVMLGPEEIVFDWDRDRCSDADFPDTPARAVRMADGSLLMAAASNPLIVSTGPDFLNLHRRCQPALVSRDDASPLTYRNNELLHTVFREGDVLHALIHNEFHDPLAPECARTEAGRPCWYNSITYMRSTDGGRSFAPPEGASGVVAPAPLRWNAAGPAAHTMQGYFNPSNIVERDGFHYSVFLSMPDPARPDENSGLCVMNTDNLSDPASWRAWDGTGFSLAMKSPYEGPNPVPACKAVLATSARASVTYNEYLHRFMLVDAVSDYSSGSLDCGFFLSLSGDLTHWTPLQKFKSASMPGWMGVCPPPAGEAGGVSYASVIDHSSASVNFDTAGQTAHLYYMRTTSAESTAPRQLVRQPMILLKPPDLPEYHLPPVSNVPFSLLHLQSLRSVQPRFMAIRDQAAWRAFRAEYTGQSGPSTPPLPEVDFSQDMVAVAVVGPRGSPCDDVMLKGVREWPDRITLQYKELTQRGATCLTVVVTPSLFVTLPMSAKPIEWIESTVP